MGNIKLSVVIPSYKDPLSMKTVRSLLDTSELGNRLEIIVVWDGYYPDFDIIEDSRVRYIHLGKNVGMREAINQGVSIARGEFIMRSDEHCKFAQGFDKVMVYNCKKDWITTATRYFLDPVKWEKMDNEPVNYEKLVIQDCDNGVKKFSGQRWRGRDKRNASKQLDQTMAMQGSMWVMSREWWDKAIKKLQTEGYGPAYQDSTEMIFKTWKAGGKMVLNKKTWYAHKHRSFSRTHQEGTKENPWIREKSWMYTIKLWESYYEKVIRKRFEI